MPKFIPILAITLALVGLSTPIFAQDNNVAEHRLQVRVETLNESGYDVFFMEVLELAPEGHAAYSFQLDPACFYFEILEMELIERGLVLSINDGNGNVLYDSVEDDNFRSTGSCTVELTYGTEVKIEMNVGENPPHSTMSFICARIRDDGTIYATPIPLPHPTDGETIEATPIPLPYPGSDETISATPITLPKPVPPIVASAETMPIPIPCPIPDDLISDIPLPIPMPAPELTSEMRALDYFTARGIAYNEILNQHGYKIICDMADLAVEKDHINGFELEAGKYILLAETAPGPGSTGMIVITPNGTLVTDGKTLENLAFCSIEMKEPGMVAYEVDYQTLPETMRQPFFLFILAMAVDENPEPTPAMEPTPPAQPSENDGPT